MAHEKATLYHASAACLQGGLTAEGDRQVGVGLRDLSSEPPLLGWEAVAQRRRQTEEAAAARAQGGMRGAQARQEVTSGVGHLQEASASTIQAGVYGQRDCREVAPPGLPLPAPRVLMMACAAEVAAALEVYRTEGAMVLQGGLQGMAGRRQVAGEVAAAHRGSAATVQGGVAGEACRGEVLEMKRGYYDGGATMLQGGLLGCDARRTVAREGAEYYGGLAP